jgi:hypothetical protein
MRIRKAVWSFARLGAYHAARENWANAHARTTLIANVAWSHATSARRRVGLSFFV